MKERDGTIVRRKVRRETKSDTNSSWLVLDETSNESFTEMCLEIVQLVDGLSDDSKTSAALKIAAIAALEVLANQFPSKYSTLSKCLPSVVRNVCSDNTTVASSCLRTVGAFINALGPRALSELPHIMENVQKRSRDISLTSDVNENPVMLSILVTLEAVVDKLGGFLNPYLGHIMELLVCHPGYVLGLDLKLKLKADVVRRLITEKINVSV